MRKIRIGVVGTGYLGSRHARIYKKSKSCLLEAVCDKDKIRLERISAELSVPGFADYTKLFNKIDAVSIAVPTKSHYKVARDFLNHNIHVLVEKPFTDKLGQADSLISLAKKNKLILQVGHIERFNCAFSSTKRFAKNPYFIECHRLSPFPNRSLDIGVILDLMIHDIDIILGLVKSKVKKIEAVGARVLTPFEDIANARLEFVNGCVCNLTSSRVSEEAVRKIRIFFKNTYISLDYKNERAFVYQKKERNITKHPLPIEREPSLEKELSSFLDCLEKRKQPVVSGQVARQALALALEIKNKILRKD